jgi:ABC-type multidrug transport system permease subunit
VWLSSGEYEGMSKELDHLISTAASRPATLLSDSYEFAVPLWGQIRLVSRRMSISLYRNTGYVNNKFILHIFAALLNGFSFWKIGNSYGDLQLYMFTIFMFIFVAPGVIAQLQPLFISRRDVFEAREKKSKTYSWIAFVTGLIISEVPYLVICAVIYFICWYYTAGLPSDTSRSGSVFFIMLMYEFLYTGIGQFIAAYAPNDVSASLVNPLLIGILVSFCGVLTPYSQIPAFWRHWVYWLNPFNYLMGSMLVFSLWGRDIECSQAEFAVFNPPNGLTCGEYLGEYLASPYGALNNLTNPSSISECQVCPLTRGEDYLYTLNLEAYHYGWRDAAIVVIFVLSSYGLVYLLMKLRSKTSKTAQ